jgi:hypothetical protein
MVLKKPGAELPAFLRFFGAKRKKLRSETIKKRPTAMAGR